MYAESKLAALTLQGEKGSAFATASVFARGYDVTRRRDTLRSPLRCERRLGGEGFEPPTLSV